MFIIQIHIQYFSSSVFKRLIILWNPNPQIKILDNKLVWKLSCILLAHYQVGDEFYIRKILREIIFNQDYLDPTDSVIWKLKNTNLKQGKHLVN